MTLTNTVVHTIQADQPAKVLTLDTLLPSSFLPSYHRHKACYYRGYGALPTCPCRFSFNEEPWVAERHKHQPSLLLRGNTMAASALLRSPHAAIVLAAWFLMGTVCADLASDEAECSNALVGLATCLPYAQGTAKAPTPDCCQGLKQVLAKSPKCLCVLVKDRNDPQLGLNLNATLALSLPSVCHSPANISECPRLLKLPPDSKDAQIFKQFGSSTQGNSPIASAKGNSTASGSGSEVTHGSGVGRSSSLGAVEILGGFLVHLLILLVLLDGWNKE